MFNALRTNTDYSYRAFAMPSASMRVVAAITAVSLLAGCGAHTIPPPAAPERIAPAIENNRGPTAAGKGRLILDAQGEHAKVVEIAGTAIGTVSGRGFEIDTLIVRPLCITPCMADLSYGIHELVFSSLTDPEKGSQVSVDVSGGTSVLRHSMGYTHIHTGLLTGGALLTTLGTLGLVGGLALTAVGAISQDTGPTHTDPGMGTGPGLTVVGIAATAIVAGIVLLVVGSHTEVQEGSSTQWRLPDAPARAPDANL